jgi:NADH dehydrogenase FAD-containing subunit
MSPLLSARRMIDDTPHHIVIVGGGAAGLELATKLGEHLGSRQRARITLVDCSRIHIWKPLLHSVAAGSLRRSQHELNYLAQAHWHDFRYRNGEMTGLDRGAKTIDLAATQDGEGREIGPKATIAYDTLVIAGSVTNDFGTPGAAEYAVPLETAEQASRFNHRLVTRVCERRPRALRSIRASCTSPSLAPGPAEPNSRRSCTTPLAPSSPMGSTRSTRSATCESF